jgi:hypothetical protein
MRPSRALPALAVAACAALAGCAGDDSGPAAQAGGVGIGEVRLADCEGWRAADVRERHETLEALRGFAGDRTGSPGGHGATLDDDDAYELIERSCEPSYAAGFKLYKLYTRAAAFQSLRRSGG